MITVILDSPHQSSIARQLPLPEDTTLLSAPVENIGEAERVIYLASLKSGGTKSQLDILRNNPQVSEWLVFSADAEEDSWMSFRDRLVNVKAPVYTFSSADELIEAMKRPVILKNSCLILSKRESPDADELITLLKTWLPNWHFEKAAFEADPEICFHTNFSNIIFLGREPNDFRGASFPEIHTPLLVITHLEDNVLQSIQPHTLMQDLFRIVTDFRWSTEVRMQNFFPVSTTYESFRLRVKNDPDIFSSLAKDSRFDMWDRYGLPESRSAYTKERMNEFLNQFNGCEKIAARLLNKTV